MPVKYEFPVTQTSHIITFVCVLAVSIALSPYGIHTWGGDGGIFKFGLRLAHLASFSGWFGTQLWVTFFAGLTMFKNLPRHTFGYIQSKLFPKYFLLGTILSCIAFVTFVSEHHPSEKWETKEKIQGIVLGSSLVTVLCNLLYIEPTTTWVMFELHKVEKKIGAGKAEGKVESDKLVILKEDPEYNALYKRFFRLHIAATVGNLLAFSAQGIHLVYLASSINSI